MSMHNPYQAAEELRRSVIEVGLEGTIINDYQSAGDKGKAMLMYDQPACDHFWAAVEVQL